jgi:hypothetical protein
MAPPRELLHWFMTCQYLDQENESAACWFAVLLTGFRKDHTPA